MEKHWPKPRILVSECLEFKPVRWNSMMISSEFVRKLKKHVDFKPVCPEVGIGGNRVTNFNQHQAGILGRIVANYDKKPIEDIMNEYYDHLLLALETPPSCGKVYNVIQHEFGHFSEKLNPDEKKFFLESLEEYRKGELPLIAITSLLKSHVARFDVQYLKQQTFLNPYPQELMDMKIKNRFCDGKDYWKNVKKRAS